MDKLFDYIASKYDSSLIERIYGIPLRTFLEYSADYRYIDDIHILKMFHDIYLDVKDIFPNTELEDIKSVSDKYLFLINRINEYAKTGNYNYDDFIIQHEPFIDTECINYVKNNSNMFSLDKMFKEKGIDGFGGVCLISKKQTVCMYNDESFGYMGSGYHNDSFHKIIKAIYNEKFVDESGLKFNDTGQDIKISFSNKSNGFSNIVRIIVDIPVPINNSQLESLKILNEEIKKIRNESDLFMEISASIKNFYDENFFLGFDNCNNIDEVLEWVVVSDSYEPFFEDKNMVGFLNGENNFNGGLKNRVKK